MAKVAANVETVEQKQKVTIGLDKSNEQILALEADGKFELVWDPREFRSLPEEVTRSFGRETLKKYWFAEAAAAELEREAREQKGFQIIENPLGNSRGSYEFRMYIRPRTGWHGYWANPGADFDRCMGSGKYVQVRKPTEAQEKAGYEPGTESGEVIKRLTADGKIEAIALECRQEDYEQYLKWMDQQSSMKYSGVKEGYYEGIENINRGITARGGRIIPQDLNEQGVGR